MNILYFKGTPSAKNVVPVVTLIGWQENSENKFSFALQISMCYLRTTLSRKVNKIVNYATTEICHQGKGGGGE